MKIAIVAPSPVPFMIGGAENLMWGLCENINQKTNHQAELIKLPSKEHNFWDLIENYHNFYMLDLTHFDLVISSKYPAWMVRHPNCKCYMMHTLRGLYDMYDKSEEIQKGVEEIDALVDYMQHNPNPESLDDFFNMVYSLKGRKNIPNLYYEFPGSFIRMLVHYMDHFGLNQSGMKSYFSISETVKCRKDYFPQRALTKVIYPPTVLKACSCKEYEYVFMISRLDAPKRIDYLIEAMRYVKNDVKLLIAGTGPEEKRLKERACNDTRIQFLGFVRDEEVEEYYANCLVVPYFPYDEDYGYITIEAMLHKKPVITTFDAGGPTEFVKNGETGFIVSLHPEQIAERIDYFAENRDKAKKMGEKGYESVRGITWENAIAKLLNESKQKAECDLKKKKITVVTTFGIYPPQGGGQVRVYDLYRQLSEYYDVEIVSYTWDGQPYFDDYIAKGLREIQVPRTSEHQEKEVKMGKKVGLSVGDIAMISLGGETPLYKEKLRASIEESNIVVLCHPYLYYTAKEYITNQTIIYEAQDVEFLIKKEMLPPSPYSEELLKQIFEVEKVCCQDSTFIMTCSQDDKEKLCELYEIKKEKIVVIPNGVDCQKTKFTSLKQRKKIKKALGFEGEKLGVFVGSWHGPNLEAGEHILEIASQCKDTKFLFMGSQCSYFEGKTLPQNIGLLGLVDEETKNRVFSAVDFALNPMLSGSGTNLKIFDYLSAGVPVITTAFGTRGTDVSDVFIVSEIDEMPEIIQNFSLDNMDERIIRGRKYVEVSFDWKVIGKEVLKMLELA